MLGFCPAGSGSTRDNLAPFSPAHMPPGRQELAMRTGSLTQNAIYSPTGKRMEHTEVKIATKSFGRVSVGFLGAQGEFLGLRVGPNLKKIPGLKEG